MNQVITAYRARRYGYTGRGYGYVIMLDKPIETVSTGIDVEGVGFVQTLPTHHVQRFMGWYRHKSISDQRLIEIQVWANTPNLVNNSTRCQLVAAKVRSARIDNPRSLYFI